MARANEKDRVAAFSRVPIFLATLTGDEYQAQTFYYIIA
jgi:hypothetical protein